MIGTKTVILICLVGFLYGRIDMFVDIALAYAMLNFIGGILVAKYLDRTGLVVYVGSFSKVLSPALRLGFAVLPAPLLNEVLDMRRLIDWAPGTIDQLTLRGFVADGHLDRHLRRTRRVYHSRRDRLVSLLDWASEEGIMRPSVSNAGIHVAAPLVDASREASIVRGLAEKGVAIEGFGAYSIEATDHDHGGLVFGFGMIDEAGLAQAVEIIRTTLAS